MAAFALILNGAVVQTAPETFPVDAALTWVDVTAQGDAVQTGWTATQDGAGVWTITAPVVPPLPIPTTMDAAGFISRFTTPEKLAIIAAAQAQPTILLWLTTLLAAPIVDLTHAETIAGVGALVTAGLLTPDRQTVILTPP